MSQEKVAKYKEAKANRKKTMKKEKAIKIVRNSFAILLVVAVVGWLGYSAVETYKKNQPRESVEVDYTEFNDYAAQIQAE